MKNKFDIPVLTVFLAITILPVAAGLCYSLLSSFGLAGFLSNGFTLEHWREAFVSGYLVSSFIYTIAITIIIIIISVGIGFLLSIYLRKKVLHGPLSFVLYIPLAIPFIVAAFISYQLLNQSGLFSRITYRLGLISDPSQFPDMINDRLGVGIIITHVLLSSVFFAILFATIFSNEKLNDYSSAARTLGAKKWYITKKIVFPIIMQRAFPTIILYAIFTFGSYEIPLLLGTQNNQMISVAIAQKFYRFNIADLPVAYAMAAMYTVFIIVIVFILYRKRKLANENN